MWHHQQLPYNAALPEHAVNACMKLMGWTLPWKHLACAYEADQYHNVTCAVANHHAKKTDNLSGGGRISLRTLQ